MVKMRPASTPGTILIVDDHPDNVELLSRVLHKQGYTIHTAPNGPLALRAVQEHQPDLVLLDIMMPHMDGYTVCQHLKADEHTRHIPVIFISGLGETMDKVQAFAVGGVDYITKPFQAEEVRARVVTHLSLRHMQRQLQEQNARLQAEIAERRRAEEEVRQHEALLQSIFEHTPSTLYIKDTQGRYLHMSRAGAAYFDLTPPDLIGKTDDELFPTAAVDSWRSTDQQVLNTGQTLEFETATLLSDGIHTFLAVKFPIYDADANICAIGGSAIDITERKQVEEALGASQRFVQKITDTIPDMLYVYDLTDQDIVYLNQQVETILGYTAAEVQALDLEAILATLLHPADIETLTNNRQRLAASQDGEVLPLEYRARHANGTWHWLYARETVFTRTADGAPQQILAVVQDITERKQIEKILRDREQFLRVIYEGVHLAIFTVHVHPDGDFTYDGINPAHERLSGLRNADIVGQRPEEVPGITPEQAARIRTNYTRCVHACTTIEYEELLVIHGQKTWWLTHLTPLQDETSRIYKLIGASLDITARKQMEAALRERESLFRRMFDQSPIGAAMVSLDYRFLRVNAVLCQITGYTEQELMHLGFPDITHPDDLNTDIAQAQQLVANQIEQYAMDKRYIRKNGAIVWIHLSVRLVRGATGKPLYFLPMMEDITERKRAEETLHTSQALLQSIIDHAPAVILVSDVTGRYQLVNRQLLAIHGLTDPQQMIGKPTADFLPPDLVAQSHADEQHILTTGEALQRELVISVGDEVRTFLEIRFPVRTATGEITAIGAIATDITARKRAEQALQQSQAILQAIIDYAPLAVFVKDLHGHMLLFNQLVATVFQLDVERDQGKHESDLFPPDIVAVWNREDQELLRTGQFSTHEETTEVAGVPHTFLIIKFPIRNAEGDIWAIGGVSADITDRKHMEEVLRASEDRLQRVIQSMPILVDAFDTNGQIVFWNDACVQVTGYTADEIVGNPHALELLYPDPHYRSQMLQDIARAASTAAIHNQEWNITCKDGQVRTIAWTDITRRVGIPQWEQCAIGVDVTEQRQAEEAYRLLVNHSLQGLSIVQDGCIIFANPAACDMTGYTLDELRAMGPEHINIAAHPEEHARIWDYYHARLAERPVPSRYEMRLIRKDGQMRWIEVFPVIIEYQGRPATQMAYIDITERVQAEQALRESQSLLRAIIDHAPAVILVTDHEGRYMLVNQQVLRHYGLTAPQQMIGKTVADFRPPEVAQVLRAGEDQIFLHGTIIQRELTVPARGSTIQRTFLDTQFPIRDPAGNIIAKGVISTDITERKQQEERLRLFESALVNANDAVLITEADLLDEPGPRIVYANAAFERMTGYTQAEILGKSPRLLQGPLTDRAALDRIRHGLEQRYPTRTELINYHKDGSTFWVEMDISPVTDATGAYTHFVAIQRDITERKQAEEALRKLQRAVEQSPSSIVITDAQARIEYVNPRFTQVTGYTLEEAYGHNPRILKSGLTPPETYRALWRAITTRQQWHGEFCNRKKNGELYWEFASISPIFNSDGHITHFVAVKEDITERKQMEEKLRLAQFALDHAAEGICWMTPDGRQVYVNDAACQLSGFTCNELLRLTVFDLDPTLTVTEWQTRWQSYQQHGSSTHERLYHRRDGTTFPVEVSMNYMAFEGQEFLCSFFRDISARKQAENALRENQALLRAIIDHSPVAIDVTDLQGRYMVVNRYMREGLNLTEEQMLGVPYDRFLPAATCSQAQANEQHIIATGETIIKEYDVPLADGEHTFLHATFPIYDAASTLFAFGGIATDITERKQSEAALQRRDAILQAMGFAAEQFLGPAAIHANIQTVLARLGTATAVSRVYLFENSRNAAQELLMNQRYEWVAPGIPPEIDNPALQALSYQAGGFARWAATLSKGEPIYGNIATFPPGERAILEPQAIRSMVIVPIFVAQTWWGFIGFDQCSTERTWSLSEVDALKATASIFGVAMQRAQIEEEIRTLNAQLEQRVIERTAQLEAAYRQLQQERNFVDAVIESSGALVIVLDPQGRIVRFNQACERITGYTFQEMRGQYFWDWLLLPQELEAVKAEFTRLRAGNFPSIFENAWVAKNGQARRISWSNTALLGADRHTIQYIVSTGIDITERVQAEEALRQSEARYRTLIETAPNAVLLTDMNNTIQFCNQQAVRLFGYQAVHDIVGKKGTDLVAPDLPDDPLSQVQNVVISDLTGTIEYTLSRNDGSTFIAEIASATIRAPDTTPTALIIVISDISERKRAEQALAAAYADLSRLNTILIRSRNLLRAIFDNLDDGLLLLDNRYIVQEVNRPFATLLDTHPEAMIGQHWPNLYPQLAPGFPGDLPLVSPANSGIFPDDERRQWQRRYPRTDGTTAILNFQGIVLHGSDQGIEQIILRVTNVTEQIRLQALLIENERFAASGRLAASVAHEINTPLQALQNSLKLLAIVSPEERATFLAYARQEIQRVGRIVHQLLDLYRPSAAKYGPVQMNSLIERILLLTGKRLRDQRVTVQTHLLPDLPTPMGRADELMQVLLNLIVNALDAMPDGGHLSVSTDIGHQQHPATLHPPGNEQADGIIITVRDTGCGIEPAMQQKIFESFVTTKEEGVGLGLAISTQIVSQHGGTITVESQPGVGSSFTVVLPLNPKPAEKGTT